MSYINYDDLFRESSRRLDGVILDPGHGGNDPGAIGNGVLEKDYNLKISLYQRDRLRELGVPVAMTRERDETLNQANRVARARSFFGTSRDVILISNHNNAGGGTGAEVIFALRNNNTFATKILNEIRSAGQVTRRVFQQRSTSNPNLDHFFILRDTANMESVIVEYAFLDNLADVNRLRANWKAYAEAVVKAICDYKGIKYIPPGGEITEYFEYSVVSGDNLFNIANRFNTTVNQIRTLNSLTSDNLRIGQVLKIPGEKPNINETTYTVQAGDTLFGIARRFNLTIDELRRINNLTSDSLSIGQVLNLTKETNKEHTVVAGDTLWSIATRYNTTVDAIMRLNNLTNNAISVGQVLQVKGELPSTKEYIVVRGDSLFSIANRFNVTVNDIRSLNNLINDNLSIGQVLKLPI